MGEGCLSSRMGWINLTLFRVRVSALGMRSVLPTPFSPSPPPKCNERMPRNQSANNKLTGWLKVVTSFKNVPAICPVRWLFSTQPPIPLFSSTVYCLSCCGVMSRIIKRPADRCINRRPNALSGKKNSSFSPNKKSECAEWFKNCFTLFISTSKKKKH